MKRILLLLSFLAGLHGIVRAQESQFALDLHREAQELRTDCSEGWQKLLFVCAEDVFTEQPLHLAVGSLAPQDGFGVGPALVVAHDTANWRLSLDSDAVVSTNASWRAGVYLQALFTKEKGITVVTDPKKVSARRSLVHEYPVVNAYAQAISLNAIDFYGIGPTTQRSQEAIFGMRETIAGLNVLYPLIPRLHVSLFGELNGRFVDIRAGGVSGVASQPGFLQAGEGIRLQESWFGDRLQPDLTLTYQQFEAPGSKYSFQRLSTNAGVNVPLARSISEKTTTYHGPDDCGTAMQGHRCPAVVDRNGSVGVRLFVTQSIIPAGNSVPFYFQPTIGGGDLNGQTLLPAYGDYRFRAPNMIVARANCEHSLYGPLGFQFLYDIGKVADTSSALGFSHLAHSFGAGLTLRVGGIPQVSFLFGFGGGEGTHALLLMNNSSTGGSGRPSLY